MEDLSSEDELDGIEDPRIMEIGSDDSDEEAPKLIPAKGSKGKNKRVASESGETLDEMIKHSQDAVNGEKPSKKQAKKLKNNAGQATEAPEEKSAIKKDGEGKNGNAKKVQFAKQLEQGPTPSPNTKTDGKKADKKEEAKGKKDAGNKPGIKMVDGVKIDDRKIGSGAGAKKGDRIGMRYIGKLEKNGKVFDGE
jgi:FK506-binding nuclear protein